MFFRPLGPVISAFCSQVLAQQNAEMKVSRFSTLKGVLEEASDKIVSIKKYAGEDCIGCVRARLHNGRWVALSAT